jgi:hypothetical protein
MPPLIVAWMGETTPNTFPGPRRAECLSLCGECFGTQISVGLTKTIKNQDLPSGGVVFNKRTRIAHERKPSGFTQVQQISKSLCRRR